MKQSNYWYNDGLKRANFRDLSGAIISLRRSLQYCRKNIAARNLLGLVYYGRGEINEALVEWIISKNLRPRDNIANYFIRKVQNAPRDLNRINANIKKYNQCLSYCSQDAEDLALIQIKKVVAAHPTYVKAYQLLALLSIRKGQYSRASQALRKAQKIDTTDGITLYYINQLAELKAQGKRSLEDRERSITYRDGNETIIQPTSATLKEDAPRIAIVNIVIGIVIGLAVMAFLIEPALDENDAMKNADAIRDYSSQVNALDAEINALKTELESYRSTNDEAELAIANATLVQETYEVLSEVQLLLDGEETSNADMAELLKEVDTTVLAEGGVEWYDRLAESIFAPICEGLYEEALALYQDVSIVEDEDGDTVTHDTTEYEPIVTALLEVISMYPDYEEYQATFMLAEAYAGMEDWENAATYYNAVIAGSENTSLLDPATTALLEIQEMLEEIEE